MFSKSPSAYRVENLERLLKEGAYMEVGDGNFEWVPARPEGYGTLRHRINLAWEVFTGRADAIRWPGNQ